MKLAERMRNYESVFRQFLVTRMPIVVRIDGKAFHSFTKGMDRPFDGEFMYTMDSTAKALVNKIQGCQFAYVQSDEINLLITGYAKVESQPWFNGNRDKIISVSASMATGYWMQNWPYRAMTDPTWWPAFDARAFNVPENDVANYFLWRAKDNYRNSIQSYAQAHFSHKQLHRKNLSDIHEMLHEKDLNWATDCTPREKNGCWYSAKEGVDYSVLPKYDSVSEYIERVATFVERVE